MLGYTTKMIVIDYRDAVIHTAGNRRIIHNRSVVREVVQLGEINDEF